VSRFHPALCRSDTSNRVLCRGYEGGCITGEQGAVARLVYQALGPLALNGVL
jgi:hypothetical protein